MISIVFKNFSCLDIAVYWNHTGVEKILLENVEQVKVCVTVAL